MRRLVLLLFVVVCLTPGTWLRSALPAYNNSAKVAFIALPPPLQNMGETKVAGLWEIESPNSGFGSYSALLAMDDGTLLAASDTGRTLHFPQPGSEGVISIERFAGRKAARKDLVDIESLTRDPQTGRIWTGYEGTNTVERFSADLSQSKAVRPPAMRGWRSNSGPEAMIRLADGRFIILSEGTRNWFGNDHPALIFAGDPVEGARPARFTFRFADGFAPVDMAQLPDGRVLVLLRNFSLGLPPRFANKIVVADPANIEEGRNWQAREIASITHPGIQDNYEGLAITEAEGGRVILWLISDDNSATFQRSLLLKLTWDPHAGQITERREPTEKAPGKPERPSENSP